jgi:uncharacterized YccA/Bax inhibitor family protein
MVETTHLNNIHEGVLDKIDRSARHYKVLFIVAACCEGVCLAAFLLVMDFANRDHWLLLITACLIYWTLSVGLLALAAWSRHGVLRILSAIELLDDGTRNDAGK